MFAVGVVVHESRVRQHAEVECVGSVHTFIRRRLRTILEAAGLDWQSVIRDRLSCWLHGTVDVDGWLRQFELLGSNRWIGETLLQFADIWDSNRLAAALGLPDAATLDLDRTTTFAVNRFVAGKSADIIANMAKKRTGGVVSDLAEAIRMHRFSKITVLEDCLLSGTEATRVVEQLLGGGVHRERKSDQVDSAYLQDCVVHLRYALVADWGKARLASFLHDRQINMRFVHDETPTMFAIEVLSAEGLKAVQEQRILASDSSVADEEFVVPLAFRPAVWKDDVNLRTRAMDMCRSVGEQLIRAFVRTKGWSWSDRRIADAALGAWRQGLLVVFAHSVPKETLPLLWARGEVKWGRRRLQWKPLLPCAE
ncbi:MAG: hypothetical protein IT379_14975 [Deltaproteobacteria bacterium]|nr:hypothetical protein [Deltaproteobacteria bacterium]